MEINNLYLLDFKLFNIFARESKSKDEFKHNVRFMLKAKNTFYNGYDNIKEFKKANGLLSLDNEGTIHALLLNLFFKCGNSPIKEYIKEKINLNGIDGVEEELEKEISGNVSIDRELLEDLINLYYDSLDREIDIDKKDQEYILEINGYYKDECERIQTICDEMSYELRKVGI